MKRITIIGVGLIGGSIALALKRENPRVEITGVGRNMVSLKKALKKGALDKATLNLKEGIKNRDLIILATPISEIISYAEEIGRVSKEPLLITDVGSTKKEIVHYIEKIPLPGFVGSHPMAGSEKRGIEAARSDLFEGALIFLTPTKRTSLKALKKIEKFWQGLGGEVRIVSPSLHDRIVAQVSHLPHLLSAAIMHCVGKETLLSAANGFKDMTRIAKADAAIWADIVLSNKENIIHSLKRFEEKVEEIKKILIKEEGEKLLQFFHKAKEQRERLDKNSFKPS